MGSPRDKSRARADAHTDEPPRRGGGGGLSRAIRLLDLVVSLGPMRFAAIEEASGLPKATLHRLLQELADARLLQYDEGAQTYRGGFRLLELANRVWARSDLRDLARDQLQALNALSGETVQLAVHADTHVVVIDVIESTQSVRPAFMVGHRAPVYCTGVGKVLLAWCDADRQAALIDRIEFVRFTPHTLTDRRALRAELSLTSEQGYAIDDEEHYLGSRCIAAPVVDHTGRAVAGISITAPGFRVSREALCRWREPLIGAAAEISRRLVPRTLQSGDAAH